MGGRPGPGANDAEPPAAVAAACVAARATRVTLREALTPVPAVDALLTPTPYTSWAVRGRGAEGVLAASVVIGAYVLVQSALDVAHSGKG